MATVKFLLRSVKGNAPIYLFFSVGRGQQIKCKTREIIVPDYWNAKQGKPKNIQSAPAYYLNHIQKLNETFPKWKVLFWNSIEHTLIPI